MRRSFSWALVIALLLRGLLGDAMATELAAVTLPSMHLNADTPLEHTPCANTQIASDALSAPCDEHPPHAHCSNCAHSLSTWAAPALPVALSPVVLRIAPTHNCTALHSALLRSQTKPPIAWA